MDAQRRRAGWRYEQGAGDDHELWSGGLDARSFWALPAGWEAKGREGVERLVDEVVRAAKETGARSAREGDDVDVVRPTTRLSLGTLPFSPATLAHNACIAVCSSSSPAWSPPPTPADDDDAAAAPPTLLVLPSKPPKSALPPPPALHAAIAFAHSALSAGRSVAVACESGTDASVGLAVVLLQSLFAEDGSVLPSVSLGAPFPPPSRYPPRPS